MANLERGVIEGFAQTLQEANPGKDVSVWLTNDGNRAHFSVEGFSVLILDRVPLRSCCDLHTREDFTMHPFLHLEQIHSHGLFGPEPLSEMAVAALKLYRSSYDRCGY